MCPLPEPIRSFHLSLSELLWCCLLSLLEPTKFYHVSSSEPITSCHVSLSDPVGCLHMYSSRREKEACLSLFCIQFLCIFPFRLPNDLTKYASIHEILTHSMFDDRWFEIPIRCTWIIQFAGFLICRIFDLQDFWFMRSLITNWRFKMLCVAPYDPLITDWWDGFSFDLRYPISLHQRYARLAICMILPFLRL